MTNKRKILLIAFLLTLLILYVVLYVVPGVTGALRKTEIINYGELKVSDPITYYLVRDEIVYTSGQSGDINYYFEEGSHVRRGTKVLDVLSRNVGESENEFEEILNRLGKSAVKSDTYITDRNGIISYHVDGLESYFSPDSMHRLTFEEVAKLDLDPVNLTRKETNKGEPLYKICDSSTWYVLGWVEAGSVAKYNLGDSVRILFPEGEISATIDNIVEDAAHWLIIMRTDMYYAEFAKTRTGEATVITANATGIIIKNQSITTDSEGNIGVYVKKKNGDYEFKPIRVINTDGETSAVEASFFYDEKGNEIRTVDVYDEILKNAGN